MQEKRGQKCLNDPQIYKRKGQFSQTSSPAGEEKAGPTPQNQFNWDDPPRETSEHSEGAVWWGWGGNALNREE